MQEFQLIEKFFKSLTDISKKPALLHNSFNLSDDIALINYNKNYDLIISKDIFIEDIHFLKGDGAKNIAIKLLSANLSDMASSGGLPLFYMLGFTKNSGCDKNFFQDFHRGLQEIQKKFNINLIGGDTANSDKLFYSITIFGLVKKNKILLRSTAKAGDLIYVSNYIGDAFLGLNIKQNYKNKLQKHHKDLLSSHYFPQPRIELSQQLLKKNLSKCATDISDGLIRDLSNICNASKLNAEIYLSQIPISDSANKYLQDNNQISKLDLLSGGDDYELIFTVNPKHLDKIKKLEKNLSLKLSCIGEFVEPKPNVREKNKKFDVFLFKNNHNLHKDKFNSDNILNFTKMGYEHQ
jgi:thiamine-monophosphate kinase